MECGKVNGGVISEAVLFRDMINLTSDAVCFVNHEGLVTISNKAAEGVLTGNSANEILAGADSSLLDQADGQTWQKKVSHEGRDYEVKYVPVIHDGIRQGTIVICKDITIQALQVQLKEEKALNHELDMIIKSSYDGIFVLDGNGIAIGYNESYSRITGINAAELMGMHISDIVKRKYISEGVALKVFNTKAVATTMPTLSTGKKVLVTGTPVFDENGELIRVVANVRDITNLINLKSELEEAVGLAERYYSEVLHLRQQQTEMDGFVFESPQMQTILSSAVKVAKTNATVMIRGDSGVGKEVIARVIHNRSEFSTGSFVKINCGAIPETLLESELFGYEKGAFTNAARSGKPGLFEIATGGTVFLDEIGEIPLSLQVKLLGVLQDKQFTKVGGVTPIEMKSRIIAATHRNLEEMVSKGQFRKDLYYRLSVIPLKIPPLAERRGDIFPLVRHFLQKFNDKYKVQKSLSPQVMDAFERYEWPGNVRELEHFIEQMIVLTAEERITIEMLPKDRFYTGQRRDFFEGKKLEEIINEVERQLLRKFLTKGYSTYKIARELGISQPTVVRKINKLGMS